MSSSGLSIHSAITNCSRIRRGVKFLKVISKYGGNISHAAKELGLSRTSLYRRLEKYGL